MVRSEYTANIALSQARNVPAWAQPSRCKRAARKGFFSRLFGL